MVNTKGIRRGTRYMFAREFRKKGTIKLSTYMHIYKRGDLVNIKGNGAIQKGMPHKIYHGKVGRVFNVSQTSLGVVVNKRVRGRYIAKRIYIRVEHVNKNKTPQINKENAARRQKLIEEAKAAGEKPKIPRQVKGPRDGHIVETAGNEPQFLEPIPYEFIA